MTVGAQTDTDFAFRGIPEVEQNGATATAAAAAAQAAPEPPLGNLNSLPGKWVGHGFNAIWRPHHPDNPQDRFLELNLTNETLVFTKINGAIPNRGLLMHDINMFGLTYMQQISEKSNGAGLHIEPGIWAHVPKTSAPNEPQTVVRMASIPHGTVILAQGTGKVVNGPPQIHDNNILPFPIGGSPAVVQPGRADVHRAQPVAADAVPVQVARRDPGDGQEPQQRAQGRDYGPEHQEDRGAADHHQEHADQGRWDRQHRVPAGRRQPADGQRQGRRGRRDVLDRDRGHPGHPDKHQLQYTQLVQLDFNGLRWPHVTVATLQKQ